MAWESDMIGKRAKEVANQEHDWPLVIKKYDAIYEKLMKS